VAATGILAMHFALPDYVLILEFAVLLLLVAHNEETGRKILELKPLMFLGEISYSMYLLHLPILIIWLYSVPVPPVLVSGKWNDFALIGLYLAAILIFSTGTYYVAEIPLRKWLVPQKKV